MAHSAKFWDKKAQSYFEKPIADQDVYEKKLEITRGYLKPDMQVLEIGCGTGGTALLHAPYVKHIRATDISANMIEIARRCAQEQGVENVSFEVCDTDALNVDGESVDAVLAMSILHLLENRDEMIARIYAMLKPGGVFVSSTACIADDMKIFKIIGPPMHALGVFPFFDVFSFAELEEAVKSAGFEIEHNWKPGKNKGVFMVAKKPA